MTITFNASGESHAKSLIDAGKFDESSPWAFSAEDGDKLLSPQGDNWAAYAQFHLAEVDEAADDTKVRWSYPYGKDGKVYRNALRAIRSRASHQGATDIFDAASRLMSRIDEASKNSSGEE